MAKRNTLGKGLGAIFTDLVDDDGSSRPTYISCGVEELQPNAFQPRRSFNKEEISSLAESIKTNGVIQPIIVRKSGSGYEIITGERRWRAAQEAGLQQVPVVLREATDRDLAEWSLIENIQREELNPVEEAEAYQRLLETFHLSQEEIAKQVGKDRSTVTNALRLLKLPAKVQEALIEGTLSAGHARALLALTTTAAQLAALKSISEKKLSVRETELLVKKTIDHKGTQPKQNKKDAAFQDLETILSRKLMSRVTLKPRKRGGTLEIRYLSSDELNRIVDRIISADSD